MVQPMKPFCLYITLAVVNIASVILSKFSIRLLPTFIRFVLYWFYESSKYFVVSSILIPLGFVCCVTSIIHSVYVSDFDIHSKESRLCGLD